METTPEKNKGLVTGLGTLQFLIGLGAVGGGLALVLEPSGSNLEIPLELLKSTPFSTYLVPGIVLLVVNGLGSLVGAAASFTRHRNAGKTAMALGVFLVALSTLVVALLRVKDPALRCGAGMILVFCLLTSTKVTIQETRIFWQPIMLTMMMIETGFREQGKLINAGCWDEGRQELN